MNGPPVALDGASVICYSPIDERHQWTRECVHCVAGAEVGRVRGLAICRYEGESAAYLFGCDGEWSVLTDTLHDSISEAKTQAEFEYHGVENTWTDRS